MKPVALVTGASGGIGEAIAHVLARDGETLVLVARSASELARVAAAIEMATGRLPLCVPLDLEARDAADVLKATLERESFRVRHLVNNAGYGLAGDVLELTRSGQMGILDLNCRALLDLTLAFLPDIVATKGGVLNVASVAAFTPGPGLAVYYASKAFVLSFSRALAFELKGQGIGITTLCPGPTATGFGKRAGFGGTRAIALTRPLDAAAVAEIGVAAYRVGRPVVVPGVMNKILVALVRVLPSAIVLAALARVQRHRRIVSGAGGGGDG